MRQKDTRSAVRKPEEAVREAKTIRVVEKAAREVLLVTLVVLGS
jgi:hypothetical protein